MQRRSIDNYNSLLSECDSNGERVNRLGRCPICNYEVVVAGCGLKVLLDPKTVSKVVGHMRLRYGIEMGKRFPRDRPIE
jgi:hypothetical protein